MRTAADGVIWLSGDHHDTAQISITAVGQSVAIRRQSPFGIPRGTSGTWPTAAVGKFVYDHAGTISTVTGIAAMACLIPGGRAAKATDDVYKASKATKAADELVDAGRATQSAGRGLAKSDPMVDLYHGTTDTAAASIMDDGLKPISHNTNPFPAGSFFAHHANEEGLDAA